MPITDLTHIIPASQIDPAIASDAELTAAIAQAFANHLNATDPHLQYPTQTRGDERYRRFITQTFNWTIKAIGTSLGLISSPTQVNANKSGIEVQAADTSSAAYMSFHRPGIWGIHFGLDTNNQLSVGGWSLLNASYKIFHEGMTPLIKAPLPSAAIAGNSFACSWNSVQPGLGIAELCNYAGTGGGPAAFDFFRLPGGADAAPTISNRVASISVTGAYSQTSDRRVKSDFRPAPGLAILMRLEPLGYKHWNCIGFDKTIKKLELGETFIEKWGFVAQDVKNVLPEAVSQPQSEEELYGIDYNCLLTCAIKSIQELCSRVVELEKQIQSKK